MEHLKETFLKYSESNKKLVLNNYLDNIEAVNRVLDKIKLNKEIKGETPTNTKFTEVYTDQLNRLNQIHNHLKTA